MKQKRPSIRAKKPKPILDRPLKPNWKDFAKGLGKAIPAYFAGKPESVASGVVDAGVAIGLHSGVEGAAFTLLLGAIVRAIDAVLEDSATLYPDLVRETHPLLDQAMQDQLSATDFDLDGALFDRPEDCPLVPAVQPLFEQWLLMRGLRRVEAKKLAARLPDAFPRALHDEWISAATNYETLRGKIFSPFSSSVERQIAWRAYARRLDDDTRKPVFGEPFSLRQLYVPLRAYRAEYPTGAISDRPRAFMSRKAGEVEKHVVDLRNAIERWLGEEPDTGSTLRALSGGPGSGKSTFARLLAADLALSGQRVLLVPLLEVNPVANLTDELARWALSVLKTDPFASGTGEGNLLLILDGLDELAARGEPGRNAASMFQDALETLLRQPAPGRLRVRVLLCGRTPVMESLETRLRQQGEVLHLLEYFVPEDDHRAGWQDPEHRMPVDQRDQWWMQFGKLRGKPWTGMPKELQRPDLVELTAQPLLNYLVALSYEREPQKFADKHLNRNAVYLDLMARVHERTYEKSGRVRAAINLEFPDFLRVLEEVALATWHGDGRSTCASKIRTYCSKANIIHLLEKLTGGSQGGALNLLAAFFFKHRDHAVGDDPPFVFTHKAFAEYLTARRFVREVEELVALRRMHDKHERGGVDEPTAFQSWVEFCGPSSVTDELLLLIRNEIAFREQGSSKNWRDHVLVWQETLCQLFRWSLTTGWNAAAPDSATLRESSAHFANASEGLLVAVNASSCFTKTRAPVGVTEKGSWRRWMQFVLALSGRVQRPTFLSCLSWLDLAKQDLDDMFYLDANFAHSNLDGVNFSGSSAVATNFQGASLVKADFNWTALWDCTFTDADLSKADFHYAFCSSFTVPASLRKTVINDAHQLPENWHTLWRKQNPEEAAKQGKKDK